MVIKNDAMVVKSGEGTAGKKEGHDDGRQSKALAVCECLVDSRNLKIQP